mmetsp:Transcript_28616/g.67062  ORF Transcript_28616/g.67062 Transcript_28616/m.67062 type:complete len:210 (+) Transcript_28616:172-801(+)
MHALSSQMVGGLPWLASKPRAHLQSASHLGAAASCHEWLKKASHPPSSARTVRSASDVVAADPSMSSRRSRSKGSTRNFPSAIGSNSAKVYLPDVHSPASTAASRSSAVEPSSASRASTAARQRGVSARAHRRITAKKSTYGTSVEPIKYQNTMSEGDTATQPKSTMRTTLCSQRSARRGSRAPRRRYGQPIRSKKAAPMKKRAQTDPE